LILTADIDPFKALLSNITHAQQFREEAAKKIARNSCKPVTTLIFPFTTIPSWKPNPVFTF
jgi:hypothetical protein